MERTITPSKLTGGLYKRRTSALGMMNLLVNLPLVYAYASACSCLS